jgi:hypothetical protein
MTKHKNNINESRHDGTAHCPRCQSIKKAPDVKYCDVCGTKLIFQCFVCIKEMPKRYPFCPWTGKKMNWDSKPIK